jgi:DNA invertase Pin-like site-specific DNA recombinase
MYVRASHDADDTRLAVTRQRDECMAIATSHGWTIGEIYADNDIGASTLSESKVRPAYDRMIADVESGKRDGIVVMTLDRYTRRLAEMAMALQWIVSRGLPFLTCEGDDTTTANGRTVIGIKLSVAQGEVERLSERAKLARAQQRASGIYQSSQSPFGYARDGERAAVRFVHDAYAPVVRDAFAAIVNGVSTRDVLRQIEAATGRTMTYTDLRRMISNPIYSGRVHYRREAVCEAVNVEPIVSEVTQLAAIARYESAKSNAHLRGVKRPRAHVLAGLVVCGVCGSRMVAQCSPTRQRWTCVSVRGGCGTLARDYAAVWESVRTFVRLAAEIDVPAPDDVVSDAEREALATIAECETRLTRVRALMVDGAIAVDDGAPMLTAIRDQVTAARRVVSAAATARQRLAQRSATDPETLLAALDDTALSIGARETLVRAYVSSVVCLPARKGRGIDWTSIVVRPVGVDSINAVSAA